MRRSFISRFVLTPAAGLAALGLPVAAGAQDGLPPVPAKLSLKEAIYLAVNYNPRHRDSYITVQDSRSRLRSAGELRQSTWDSSITKINANQGPDALESTVGSTLNVARTSGSTLAFNGQVPWVGTDDKVGLLGMQLTMPLTRGHGTVSEARTSIDRAGLSVRNSELGHFLNQQQLVQQVVTDYFTALRTRELIKVQERSVEFNQQIASDTKKRLDAGLITEIDLTRAQQQLSSAQVTLVNRTQSAQNALDDLVLVLGLPVGTFPELTDEVPYAPVEVDVNSAIREALAHRPELEQYRVQRSQAQIDLAVSKDHKRPKMDLVANLTNAGLGILGSGGLGHALSSLFGLRVSVPVSKKTLQENQATAERNLAILDYLESYQRQQIVDEVRGLARSAEAARKNLELLTANLQIAQRAVQIAQRFIEEGLKDNRDLLEAQQQVTSTESSILDAKVNYFLTMVNLRRALGQDLLEQFGVEPLKLPERPLVASRKSGSGGPNETLSSNERYGREAYPASLR